jgi:hypothetical protein
MQVTFLNALKQSNPCFWKAISQLEQSYQATDPATKTAIAEVEQSLKTKDYEGAAVGVQVLQGNPNRTFEQSQVLKAMMSGLQREIAEGIERGDPNAIKAAEALKRRR